MFIAALALWAKRKAPAWPNKQVEEFSVGFPGPGNLVCQKKTNLSKCNQVRSNASSTRLNTHPPLVFSKQVPRFALAWRVDSSSCCTCCATSLTDSVEGDVGASQSRGPAGPLARWTPAERTRRTGRFFRQHRAMEMDRRFMCGVVDAC